MITNYLKTALRIMLRQKGYSAINIIGLGKLTDRINREQKLFIPLSNIRLLIATDFYKKQTMAFSSCWHRVVSDKCYFSVKKQLMQTKHKSIYQATIKAPVNKLWDALTNPQIVKQYFFGSNMVTDWEVGNPIIFQGEYEGKPYKDKGIVLEYSPNKSLSYPYLSSWAGLEDKPDNYLVVSYQVKEVTNGTQLTITQTNYDEEKAKHSEGNWKKVVDDLKKVVE